jgi:alkylation response protein AidB-like acyl-CoA dehydrogenase
MGSPKTQHYIDIVHGLTPELEKLADEVEETEQFPTRAFELLADNDLLRLTLPTEFGGQEMSLIDYFPVLQEVARIHGTFRMFVHGQNGMWRLVEQWGSQEQKERWLPVHRQGGIFTFGLTEPDNGTGRDISTTAVRDGDEWVINGRKHLISWAGEAELVHLIAKTGDERGKEATCFLLPKGTPGVRVEKLAHTMGCKGGSHDRMIFEDCRLPANSVLGEEGQGLYLGLRGFLDVSRLSIAVSCLGLARQAMDLAVDFAKARVTFGKAIATRQAMRLSIAEMAADIYSLRATTATPVPCGSKRELPRSNGWSSPMTYSPTASTSKNEDHHDCALSHALHARVPVQDQGDRHRQSRCRASRSLDIAHLEEVRRRRPPSCLRRQERPGPMAGRRADAHRRRELGDRRLARASASVPADDGRGRPRRL